MQSTHHEPRKAPDGVMSPMETLTVAWLSYVNGRQAAIEEAQALLHEEFAEIMATNLPDGIKAAFQIVLDAYSTRLANNGQVLNLVAQVGRQMQDDLATLNL